METKTFSALADPNRLRIIELLLDKPYSVNEVAKKLGLLQPQTSKHLHTLQRAGLVISYQLAQRHIYVINPEPFRELGGWLGLFEKVMDRRLYNLDRYLKSLKER